MLFDYFRRIVRERTAHNCAVLGGAVLIFAALIELLPGLQAALEFNRSAIAAGEVWRIFTCHFVHWGWAHLAGDISALLGLCWLMRNKIASKKFVIFGAITFMLVGLSVLFDDGGVSIYRGMSGINHALLGWVLMDKVFDRNCPSRWMPPGLLLILLAKVVGEFSGLFTVGTGLPEGIQIVAVAHITGLAGGMTFGCVAPLCDKLKCLGNSFDASKVCI